MGQLDSHVRYHFGNSELLEVREFCDEQWIHLVEKVKHLDSLEALTPLLNEIICLQDLQ